MVRSDIASLNDRFRMIGPETAGIPGCVVATRAIANLPEDAMDRVVTAVRTFVDFNENNDPHGEHDLGTQNVPGVGKVMWKIDYYADETTEHGSEAPDDLSRCYRVLTIMLASEY